MWFTRTDWYQTSPPALTLHAGFMRREDAGVSTGGGADVQVELDVFLQPEAVSVVTPGEDGVLLLLLLVTGDTETGRYVRTTQSMLDMQGKGTVSWSLNPVPQAPGFSQQPSPEERVQLGVQVPDERAASQDLGVAVVEGQTSIAHVFTVDALCSCGHTDDLGLLHIGTWTRRYGDRSLWCHQVYPLVHQPHPGSR